MTIGSDFRSDAQEIIYEFSVENGKNTYSHDLGRTYNTSTGIKTPSYQDHEYYIAFDEIMDGVGSESTLNAEYLQNHMQALIAGADLLIEVTEGDLITLDGEKHKVVYWETDMYKALYTLHITRKPI